MIPKPDGTQTKSDSGGELGLSVGEAAAGIVLKPGVLLQSRILSSSEKGFLK